MPVRQSFIPALSGKTETSIPHSPAGFKREMRFLEVCRRIDPTHVAETRPVFASGNAVFGIVGGAVRAVFAFVRRQDDGSPCGGRLGEAPLPDGRSKLRPSRCGGYARGELSQRL